VLVAMIVLVVAGIITSPAFVQPTNLLNVTRQVSMVGILSVGMTFVILSSGIDLSVGSIVAVGAVLAANSLQQEEASIVVAIVVPILVGILLGSVNGIGIAIGRIAPFIMTLAMMVMGSGIALTIARGQPMRIPKVFLDPVDQPLNVRQFNWLANDYIGPVPVPVIVFAVILIVAALVLAYTSFGRSVYAVGGNREAARLCGLNVTWVTVAIYAISGFLAGVVGVLWASRVGVGEPWAGKGTEFDAIGAVVIGGTSFAGGQGSVWGTLVGALIFGLLANLMNLWGIPPFSQVIAKGAIIVVTMLFAQLIRR
jgi:ribose/xylose/arabinose/galactoside ABC-type transport system permease subunit